MSDLSDIRREYTQGGLRRANLPANPMDLFEQWMQQAKDAQLSDPTAMCVATVDEDGQPFQRIVLLKKFDDNGFVFFTNLESRKAKQIAVNSKISLLFPWHPLDRQVAVLGQAEPLSMQNTLCLDPKTAKLLLGYLSNQAKLVRDRPLKENLQK